MIFFSGEEGVATGQNLKCAVGRQVGWESPDAVWCGVDDDVACTSKNSRGKISKCGRTREFPLPSLRSLASVINLRTDASNIQSINLP